MQPMMLSATTGMIGNVDPARCSGKQPVVDRQNRYKALLES